MEKGEERMGKEKGEGKRGRKKGKEKGEGKRRRNKGKEKGEGEMGKGVIASPPYLSIYLSYTGIYLLPYLLPFTPDSSLGR